jgi:hypothetical protein
MGVARQFVQEEASQAETASRVDVFPSQAGGIDLGGTASRHFSMATITPNAGMPMPTPHMIHMVRFSRLSISHFAAS